MSMRRARANHTLCAATDDAMPHKPSLIRATSGPGVRPANRPVDRAADTARRCPVTDLVTPAGRQRSSEQLSPVTPLRACHPARRGPVRRVAAQVAVVVFAVLDTTAATALIRDPYETGLLLCHVGRCRR